MHTYLRPTLFTFTLLWGCDRADPVKLQALESSASVVEQPSPNLSDTGDPSSSETEDTGVEPVPATLLDISIVQDPDCAVCATAHLTLDKPALVSLSLGLGENTPQPWVRSAAASAHSIPLLALRGDSTYHIDIFIDGAYNSDTRFTTAALPEDLFPPIVLTKGGDDRSQPGLTLMNVLEWSNPISRRFFILAIDEAGEIVWYRQIEKLALALAVDEQKRIYTTNSVLTAMRIDPYGQTTTEWPVDDLGISSVHHEVRPIAGGGMALLTTELEAIDGWSVPPLIDHTTFNIVGDRFAVFDAEGNETWSWSMLDHFNPLEHYTSDLHMGFWEMPPYLDVDSPKDWSHANTLIPSGDHWLASFRNLDWILQVNPENDEVEWVFGPNGDFSLADGSRWFSRQHRPTPLSNGNLLLYDNGLDRADATEDEEAFSRVVEYELDLETMTASEVWSWDGGESYLCTIAGGISVLENGNHLINDGAIHHGLKWVSERWQPHYSGRIREIANTDEPEVLWEVTVGHPGDLEQTSWFVYRVEKIDSLYPDPARPE